MNIVHMRSTTGFYGAEKVIYNIFNKFKYDDITLQLLTLENNTKTSSLLREKLSSCNFPVEGFQVCKKFDRNVINSIQLKLKSENVQLVHTHDYKSLFYAVMSRGDNDYFIVHHLHGYLNNTFAERIYSVIEKILISKTSLVFVVSEDLKGELSKSILVRNANIKYLENGTNEISDINKDIQVAGNEMKISFIARFTYEKNHLLALKVAKCLYEKNISFKLDFYGDGPLFEMIQNEIHLHNLEAVVTLHGFTDNLKKIYEATDILLITSLTEGLPMVLLEAMSYGIPVVSTNVGQIEEVFNNETCGILIPFDVDDIVTILSDLFLDVEKREKLSVMAKSIVEQNYSVSRQAKTIYCCYRELLKNG